MNKEPDKPYVYQPLPAGSNGGAIYGVAGVKGCAPLRGLDKDQAEKIRDLVIENPDFSRSLIEGFRRELNLNN